MNTNYKLRDIIECQKSTATTFTSKFWFKNSTSDSNKWLAAPSTSMYEHLKTVLIIKTSIEIYKNILKSKDATIRERNKFYMDV